MPMRGLSIALYIAESARLAQAYAKQLLQPRGCMRKEWASTHFHKPALGLRLTGLRAGTRMGRHEQHRLRDAIDLDYRDVLFEFRCDAKRHANETESLPQPERPICQSQSDGATTVANCATL